MMMMMMMMIIIIIIIIIVVYYVRRLERRWSLGPTHIILIDWLKLHVLITRILASVQEEVTYTQTASPCS